MSLKLWLPLNGTIENGGKGIWPIPDPITSSTTEFTMSVWFSVNNT